MNWWEMSKGELITHIRSLEAQNRILHSELNIKELHTMPWAGNLGQWQWLPQINKVYFNGKKVEALGYALDEIPQEIGFQFFTDKLHPEDYDYVMDNMRDHMTGKTEAYEVEYRIKAKNGEYMWYYDRGVVAERDTDGSPILITGIVFDITAQKKMESELKEQLNRDELTGCYNRHCFLEQLKYQLAQNEQQQNPFCLVMIDIDNFKKINDTFGHSMGDQVLRLFVHNIQTSLEPGCDLYRIGGEEFIVLCRGYLQEELLESIEELRIRLNEYPYPMDSIVTASFGITEYRAGDSLNVIFSRVDRLMYQAKIKGKDCIVSDHSIEKTLSP